MTESRRNMILELLVKFEAIEDKSIGERGWISRNLKVSLTEATTLIAQAKGRQSCFQRYQEQQK